MPRNNDPEKRRAYDRAWHAKNSKRRTAVQTERQRERKKWLQDEVYANASCAHCGESDPVVLDFHHLDRSQKLFSISRSYGMSKQRILDEVAKCVPLCANCHRREEHKIRNPGLAEG